jgi:hypothetical protein
MHQMLTCVNDRRPVMSGRLLTGEPPCGELPSGGISDTAANGEMRACSQIRCNQATRCQLSRSAFPLGHAYVTMNIEVYIQRRYLRCWHLIWRLSHVFRLFTGC